MNLGEIDYQKLIHIIIGGLIYLLGVLLLDALVQSIAYWIFRNTGIGGVLAYEEAQNAYYIIILGATYLSSGFLGGLYTGYKIKEKLKLIMMFPSIIGFPLTFIPYYFFGYQVTLFSYLTPAGLASLSNLTKIIIIPMLISLSGSYLGGYTINWEIEEVVEEKISLLLEES